MHHTPKYMDETIGVKTPDGLVASIRVAVQYTEDDIDIARRLVSSFDVGTVFVIDGNRFKVISKDPSRVEAISRRSKSPSTPRETVAAETEEEQATPASSKRVIAAVGQSWVTKDPRRKQEPFKVMGVYETHLVTDKGATIKLDRLSRYRLVS